MKTILTSLLFITALVLTGCAGTTEIQQEVVTNTRTKVVSIPDTLLDPCNATTPPKRESYVAGSKDDRIEMLITYSQDLLKDLAKCNNNISKIRKLQQDQQVIYDKTVEKH